MKDNRISISHGSGGKKTNKLIKNLFLKHFKNPGLERLEDSFEFPVENTRLAITVDSHVVYPLFFPGGDIGKLSINGTLNDLAVKGARGIFITAGFIIREGLKMETLEKIVSSMAKEAKKSMVKIVAGDTKVIEAGEKEEIYITTTGFGVIEYDIVLSYESISPGDKVIITGSVGDHEASVILAREDFGLKYKIESDTQNIYPLLEELFKERVNIKFARDPTRGGIAGVLNEISEKTDFGFVIEEEKIPVKEEVRGVCDFLGTEPWYMACEGRAVIIVSQEDAPKTLGILKKHPQGRDAQIIGEVVEKPFGVWLKTPLKTTRALIWIEGEQLPRIC